jgi:hypothetical protein
MTPEILMMPGKLCLHLPIGRYFLDGRFPRLPVRQGDQDAFTVVSPASQQRQHAFLAKYAF